MPDSSTDAPAGDDFKSLVAREFDLSRRLGLTLRRPDIVDPWVELAKVRAAIPADAILVEFVRITIRESTVDDFLTRGFRPPRYAAWVIPPAGRGEVSLIDLGPADDLEQVVSDALRGLHSHPEPRSRGGLHRPGEPDDAPATEKKVLAALQVLSDRLYSPLRAHLEPAQRWVLSPDAALWLVPWAALPVAEGQYALEHHLIHLVVSGRDLLASPPAGTSTPPAILADPDYDLAPELVRAEARKAAHEPTASRGVLPPRAPLRSGLLSDTVPRLPSTRYEAEAIKPLMAAYAGVTPNVFLEGAASETVFKTLRGPKALVLSTHGFFLGGPEPAAVARQPLLGPIPLVRTGGNRPSPLLRCGLMLAGYNKRATNPTADNNDDGLLTGMEVVSVDLRGTDLVVLSACETGLGDVRVGEGVAGLRQVFQLAGAGAVVATLWQVPDIETYQLVSAFFQGLSRRRGPASALREAQLALIADRRARLGAAHPYFWAAFSLTGFPGPSSRDELVVGARSSDLPLLPESRPGGPATADAAAQASRGARSPATPSPTGGPATADAAARASGAAVSPVTGRPAAGSLWSDAALVVVLLSGGSYAARWWWRLGGAVVS